MTHSSQGRSRPDPSHHITAQSSQPLPVWAGDAAYGNKMLADLGRSADGMRVAIAWHEAIAPSPVFPAGSGYNWRTGSAYDALAAIVEGFKQIGSFDRDQLRSVLLQDNFAADGFLGSQTVQFANANSLIDGVGEGDRRPLKGLELGVLVQAECKPEHPCSYGKPN